MAIHKEKHKSVIIGYFYACCPYCRNILTQGKNGTDTFSRCSQCGRYIHIVVRNNSVFTEEKEI